jgi:oligopeptide transport system ATP-binding protein
LRTISGEPPDMSRLPPGCPFSPRCAVVRAECPGTKPALVTAGDRRRACHLPVAA